MVDRLVPSSFDPDAQSGNLLKYALYALGGLILFCGAAAIVVAVIQEDQKFASVYQQLGIEPLPKSIENMPYVQVELVKLRAKPCDQFIVNSLADSLSQIGQPEWSKRVRGGFTSSCMRSAPTAQMSDAALAFLAQNAGDAETRRMALQIQQNLCNQPGVKALLQKLPKTRDNQLVTQIGEGFLANCARDVMVAYATMQSEFSVGNFARALALTQEFEQVEPNDAFWPYWRGRTLSQLGRHSEAADAHLRSLGLWPRPENVVLDDHWRAAEALRGAGRYCEGKQVLERYIAFAPDNRHSPDMTAAINNLSSLGNCR